MIRVYVAVGRWNKKGSKIKLVIEGERKRVGNGEMVILTRYNDIPKRDS